MGALGTIVIPVSRVPSVPLGVVYQPANTYPGLIGPGGVAGGSEFQFITDPGGLVNVCVAGVPPLPLKVSTTCHLAQYVVSVLGTVEVAVSCAPPVAAGVLNQPANTKPSRVGGGGSVPTGKPAPLIPVCVSGVPSLALKVRLTRDSGSHTAVNSLDMLFASHGKSYAYCLSSSAGLKKRPVAVSSQPINGKPYFCGSRA